MTSEADTRKIDLDDETETHPLSSPPLSRGVGSIPEESTPNADIPGTGGKTGSQTIFNWMQVRGCLWLLNEEHSDTTMKIVGPRRLFKIASLKNKTISDDHPALTGPEDPELIERTLRDLRFLVDTLPRSEGPKEGEPKKSG